MCKKHLLLLSVIAAGFAGCDPHATSPSVKEQCFVPAGEIGSQLADFSGRDLQGRNLSTAELRGKVVLIDFWATWCAPCEKEMPGYQTLVDRYGSQGLTVVGLKASMMKDTEDPVQFAKRIGIRYPLAVAKDDLNQKFGGIEGLPTTMLYDRAGILRKKVIGFEYTSIFESELNSLLRR
jgi:thiol-disulfide isomerase/thioredoxin